MRIIFEWPNTRPISLPNAGFISLVVVASLQSADANRAVWP